MGSPRTPYPSDVTDEERAFVAPSLTPMVQDAPQRRHDLREVFNALRWLARVAVARHGVVFNRFETDDEIRASLTRRQSARRTWSKAPCASALKVSRQHLIEAPVACPSKSRARRGSADIALGVVGLLVIGVLKVVLLATVLV